ncbi:MAG TPA: hypothetical protein VLZ28_00565 [Daejeonella sp.]|nr:hypothetical protein [Daejeonella sp.]
MSTVSLTKLYDLLSEKVGKETAENLTQYIESKIKEEVQDTSKVLATRQDISDVKEAMAHNKADVIKWMFVFWIGQTAVTFGFILLFLNN